MGRTRTKDKSSDQKDIRESEKQRAKRNRDRFRLLILELNNCISTENMSTNKTLSSAISILALEKVHSSKVKRENLTPSPSSSSSCVSQCSVLNGSASSLNGSAGSLNGPTSALSQASRGKAAKTVTRELEHLLSARDCFGLGFNEAGIILYSSPNFKNVVGYKESVVGETLGMLFL